MTQELWDLIGFPLRAFLLNEKWQARLGLTTLMDERVRAVFPRLEGRVLDIGCGSNRLIRAWRAAGNDGIGVDVFNFEGVDMVVDTTALPFKDGEFDTVVMMANLNHIPAKVRPKVLAEAHRVLKPGGKLVATMIDPVVGWFCHKLTWWDYDQEERGMTEGEVYGLTRKATVEAAAAAGFAAESVSCFVYGMNKLFVFIKK
ncbi:MAG TPA: hypothetical protein DCS63_09005 [Elusimicrobia bacterium]|nr:hypothetical protein [Elusimicrobiota bacterium]